MTEPPAKRLPTIPLLLFAAIDLVLALILLVDDGLSVGFFLVAAIGLALAGLGLSGVWRRAPQ